MASIVRAVTSEMRLQPDGSNYRVWRQMVEMLLVGEGLGDFIKKDPIPQAATASVPPKTTTLTEGATEGATEGTPSEGEKPEGDPPKKTTFILDAQGRYIVFATCHPDVAGAYLQTPPTTHQMLVALQGAFQPAGAKRGFLALNNLLNLQWDDSLSATQFIAAFRGSLAEVTAAGLTTDSALVAYLLLEKTRQKYSVWTEVKLAAWGKTPPTIEALCADLDNQASSPETAVGMAARASGVPTKCPHCGRKGHPPSKCWKEHPEQKPEWAKLRESERKDAKSRGGPPTDSDSRSPLALITAPNPLNQQGAPLSLSATTGIPP